MEDAGYRVVAVMFFGERGVGRFPTLEQAEWRAGEMNQWAKRNPRGYIHYLVRPVEPRKDQATGSRAAAVSWRREETVSGSERGRVPSSGTTLCS